MPIFQPVASHRSAYALAGGLRRDLLAAGLLAAVAMGPWRAMAAEPYVVLASTTSVENSGLLGHVLPRFTAQTGIGVRVVALGTGQALAVAARGDADLVLVHDPDAEAGFMAAGHGESRQPVAWNDFILVGPRADPAGIAGGRDAPAALRQIAAAQSPFVSRGDSSGTHAQERRLWAAAGIDPVRTGLGWYRDIGGGMGAALNAAAAMGAYTLSDRGTWLAFGNRGGMQVAVEKGAALLNHYSVILPTAAGHRVEGREPARRLAAWLVSDSGQDAIGGYTVGGEQLFHPVADPLPP